MSSTAVRLSLEEEAMMESLEIDSPTEPLESEDDWGVGPPQETRSKEVEARNNFVFIMPASYPVFVLAIRRCQKLSS